MFCESGVTMAMAFSSNREFFIKLFNIANESIYSLNIPTFSRPLSLKYFLVEFLSLKYKVILERLGTEIPAKYLQKGF